MAKLFLSQHDRRVLELCVKYKICKEVDAAKLPLHHGAIVLPCADGDQMIRLFMRILDILTKGGNPRPHWPALNGGGAILLGGGQDLPKKYRRWGDVLFENVVDSVRAKDIETVLNLGHAPCFMAYKILNWPIERVIDCLFRGKTRIRKSIHGSNGHVTGHLHVDWGQHDELYYMDRNLWISMRSQIIAQAQQKN